MGNIAPGETTPVKILYLSVPSSFFIRDIKIALIDTGGLNFSLGRFSVETSIALDYNIIPRRFFMGVNTNNRATNTFNIDVPNFNRRRSQFVYLSVNVPGNAGFIAGTVRYKWFFNYHSGV